MGLRMPPKLAEGVKKIAMIAPLQWIARIDAWRRHQPDMPNLSEAIRRLVELGLEASKGKKSGKP
jgi:hypothetical protein